MRHLACTPVYPQSSAAKIFTPEEEMSEDLSASLGADYVCPICRLRGMGCADSGCWRENPDRFKSMPQQSASLGADHMQPVETHCSLCREPFEGSDWLAPDDHGVGKCIDAAYYAARESTKAQPAPAPREITDAECEQFVNEAWSMHGSPIGNLSVLVSAVARYAIRQIESARAPQTAPRDPYKRGQLLP